MEDTVRSIGVQVVMTDDALENYGEEYRDVVLTITNVATNEQEHPGYDESLNGMELYDFQELNSSLYEFEIEDI